MRRLRKALLIFRWLAEVFYIYVASYAPCIDIHPFSAAMPVRMIATSGTDVPCSNDSDGLKGTGSKKLSMAMILRSARSAEARAHFLTVSRVVLFALDGNMIIQEWTVDNPGLARRKSGGSSDGLCAQGREGDDGRAVKAPSKLQQPSNPVASCPPGLIVLA